MKKGKSSSRSSKKPYEQRTDLEKIKAQWTKIAGLHSRDEWSSAIVRAATAAEIAANFAVRKELLGGRKLEPQFVNSLLRWANGLDGKLNRLLLPVSGGTKRHGVFRALKTSAEEINQKRNAVSHQGEFCNIDESKKIIRATKRFIEALVGAYKLRFKLKDVPEVD